MSAVDNTQAELVDSATLLGLTMTIEDWMALNPCDCEARCVCDEEAPGS